jgi:glycosyltransferase involved in cell wall biosynthesis
MKRVDLLAPAGVHDALRTTGGFRYDREVANALSADGWSTHIEEIRAEVPVGFQPREGAAVLVDGLLLERPGGALAGAVPLLHRAPPDRADVVAALSASPAIVTTSASTREHVLELLAGVHTPPIVAATPGVGRARPVDVSPAGQRLRAVGALVPLKGHDVLLSALGRIRDLPWHCELVGATDLAPDHVRGLRRQAVELGIGDRIVFAGAWRADPISRLFDGCDLLVHPSRREAYGMVIAEAIACGVPVLTSDVGGTREALGGARGAAPGMLVRPGDPAMLADALRIWLSNRGLRLDLTATARDRSRRRRPWSATARVISEILAEAAVTA